MDLQKEVLFYNDEAINSLVEVIKRKSVKKIEKDGAPFGTDMKVALEYFLDLGKKLGLKTTNYDNYIGEIEFGDGEETLGILGHIDVVPEGKNWTYPPFAGEIVDGKIYGRGASDNKGPVIACLYAMKCLKDLNVKLNKKVRLLIGCDEENDWECIKYYFDFLNKPQPEIAFTPDAIFPVIFSEKGIFQFDFIKKSDEFREIYLEGGIATNSVPDMASIILKNINESKLIKLIEKYNENKEYKINYKKVTEEKIEIFAQGKAAHGAMVEMGYNSIQNLFCFLKEFHTIQDDMYHIVNFFHNKLKMELDGNNMEVKFIDSELGDLTINIGKIQIIDNELRISFDIRYPAKLKLETLLTQINKIKKEYEFEMEIIKNQNPLYKEKNSYLISTLLSIYKEVTGEREVEPISLSGGTYARALHNCVAFGARFKNQRSVAHQVDEFMDLENFKMLLKIYIETIYKLAN
ncbi:dipeptidase PepV (plasmid) [Cetobacterium somerae]|uniref:dipeptidase PepV n=1 Tax=Cetobacterium somerae TaxID=188913 RepID=UPI002E7C446F|nr:dipeptidase PepV [Cetobacterium somerae]WVJ02300.1 dipeptidase PepV [Cetobacterium somerae]